MWTSILGMNLNSLCARPGTLTRVCHCARRGYKLDLIISNHRGRFKVTICKSPGWQSTSCVAWCLIWWFPSSDVKFWCTSDVPGYMSNKYTGYRDTLNGYWIDRFYHRVSATAAAWHMGSLPKSRYDNIECQYMKYVKLVYGFKSKLTQDSCSLHALTLNLTRVHTCDTWTMKNYF